jgi:hypothetical protein
MDEIDMHAKVYESLLEQRYDEGIEKGVERAMETVVTALLKQGFDETVIGTVTNLPLETLRLLIERIKI